MVAPFSKAVDRVFDNSLICGLGYLAVVAAIATFVVIDSWESPDRLMSGVGVVSILTFGFVFSAHPGYVRWRHVVWGIGIEFCLGLAVLRWEVSEIYVLTKFAVILETTFNLCITICKQY